MTVFDVFFVNDTATAEIYTLSLHDALPIFEHRQTLVRELENYRMKISEATGHNSYNACADSDHDDLILACCLDRKSTRLNSSHANISYAVFCLKKKNTEDSNSN